MKKSALKEFIRNQIISELTLLEQEEEVKNVEDQNKKNEETKELIKAKEEEVELKKQVDDLNKQLGIQKEEEEGPSKSDIKKTQGLAKTKEDLARIEREMRTLARDYSKAEGVEKEKLLNILKDKTKIKKELVKLLDRV
tara:strand:+ start:556 stop:972 length:417 start_codon:yes stop_codon:yes gene_type:complete